MATVSYCDQSEIKHRRKVAEAKALGIIVPSKSNCDHRFQKLLKETLIPAPLSFRAAALTLLWIDESENE